jgi:hypothetical protein
MTLIQSTILLQTFIIMQKKVCMKCTRCDYEVLRRVLMQTYLYIYSLLRGVTFKALPLSSYVLSPVMLPLLGSFGTPVVKYLSVPFSHFFFFGCLQYLDIFIPLWQTLFLETARSHSEPNRWTRIGCSISVIDFWDRSCLTESTLSWSIIMEENPIVGPKFSPFSMQSFK